MFGRWKHWLAETDAEGGDRKQEIELRDQSLQMAFGMINANPGLMSPIRDDFAIKIGLFLMLVETCGRVDDVRPILTELALRIKGAIRMRVAYPITSRNYHDLVEYPVDQSDYFKRNTKGSVLYPLLVTWLDTLGANEARNHLAETLGSDLAHCTQQVWLPDEHTDDLLWSGIREQGVAISGLDLLDPDAYEQVLRKACKDHLEVYEITALRIGCWPMLLAACRHYRMPVPPKLWFLHGRLGPKKISLAKLQPQ